MHRLEGGRRSLLESRAMRPVAMNEAEVELRLEASVSGLADRVPLVSARSLVSPGQRNVFIGLVIVVVFGLVLDARLTISLIFACFTVSYLIAVIYRAYLFTRSSKSDALEIVTDEEALSVPDSRIALLHDPAPGVQRSLGHYQADREPRPDGLSRKSARGPAPD